MKKWVIAGGVAWVALMAAGVLALTMRTRPVATADLEFVLASGDSDGQLALVGAWQAPGGTCLARAEHEVAGDSARVWLFCRPSASKPRFFRISLPAGVQTVTVLNPDGTETSIVPNAERERSLPADTEFVVLPSLPRK